MSEKATSAAPQRHSWLHALGAMPVRRGRWAVLFCIILVFGSLSLAAALQMLLDQSRAGARRAAYNQIRASEILASTEDRLSHFEAVGLLFADGGLAEEAVVALPGVRGIAVASEFGQPLRHSGTHLDMPAMAALLRSHRTVITTKTTIIVLFRATDRVVALAFDRTRLLPKTMLADCAIYAPTGARLGGLLHSADYATAQGTIWPVRVHAAWPILPDGGLWGRVPVLFIYLILVPLAAGGWLFWIFRRELIWRAQASLIIRTLRQAWLQQQKADAPDKRRPT